mmetsp:Transcript_19816/g.61076  ORF Transcript_19816/g.61076 Transcript_19816/m.61076 type:complete len:234 (+) Transcript_19816:550-1251(+)
MNVGSRRVGDQPEAALFDVDGTLVDSMPRFFPSWNEAGSLHGGLVMTEDAFYNYAGWPLPDIARGLYKSHHGTDATDEWVAEFLATKKKVHAAREKTAGTPPPIDAVAAIARKWTSRGVPVIAATSGLRDHVEHHLAEAGLGDLFPSDKIVTAADLPKGRGKPLPDIFIEAARMAGADVTKCVAYEDAEAGLESAWRAGCEVVDVTACEGYPLPEGLRKAKEVQRGKRAWLVE